MKQISYLRIIIFSLAIGTLVTLSIFLEGVIDNYAAINDIILFIPREVADVFFECWWCPSKFIFIAVFTFLFYSMLGFLVLYSIRKIRKKIKKK